MSNYEQNEATAFLQRTPHALRCLLDGMPDGWLDCNEGPDPFSPREVVAHLVHGERTDWLERVRIILEHGPGRPFTPFDRFGHRAYAGGPIHDLLDEFDRLRHQNLAEVRERVGDTDLDRPGTHPALGPVTLRQLLAAWVVHDLTHIAQIARVMARRYAEDVGPWQEYMGVLQWRR